jgi:hypothetical protein
VIESPQGERLPQSVGGLVDFAFASYARRAGLYVSLALAVFAVGCVVEVAMPGAKLGTPRGDLKLLVFEYASLFVDSYVIAAVALGVGSRLTAGEQPGSRVLAGAALGRWLPVMIAYVLVQTVIDFTVPLSGLDPVQDAALLLFAPIVWLVWGMLSLALPITALSNERPALAVIAGLSRAVSLSLRPANLPRLVIVAFVSIIPYLLQVILRDVMLQHHVDRPFFWANVPVDALTVGPVAALQTVFAIDFARRAADQRSA